MINADVRAYYELKYSVLNMKHNGYSCYKDGEPVPNIDLYSPHDFMLSVYGLKQRLLDVSRRSDSTTTTLDFIADWVQGYLNPYLCAWHPKFFKSYGKPIKFRGILETWELDTRRLVKEMHLLMAAVKDDINEQKQKSGE